MEALTHPKRPVAHRWVYVGVLVAAVAAVGLALLVRRLPPGLSRGAWVSAEASERLALEFEHSAGLISGTVHQLRHGKELVEWGFVGRHLGAHSLELTWGNDVRLDAVVDLRLGQLTGHLLMPDGSARDLVLERSTVEEVPGLPAQPELPYRLRSPAPGSGWEVARPAEAGISPRHLEKTVRALTRGEAGLLHSVVLTRFGKLVAEEYFHGYTREDLHEIQSSTKSVVSLLVGIARDQGHIVSLEQSVLDYFPEYADTADPRWRQVDLRHLLTMTAGVDWSRQEVFSAHGTGPALFQKVFSRRVTYPPGSRWLYNGADVNLLAGVLHRATGLQTDEFAARHLFEPLGITEWDWELGKSDGYPSLAGTLHLRPIDMAKIGQLILDGGRWRGQQVISEEWVKESTAPILPTQGGGQRYGYLWWRLSAPVGGGEYPVIVASGWGSQFIHVVPPLDAVIVTTGGNHFNNKNYAIGEVLLRRLVPGVKG